MFFLKPTLVTFSDAKICNFQVPEHDVVKNKAGFVARVSFQHTPKHLLSNLFSTKSICFRGAVSCLLCHSQVTKNHLLRHITRQHKDLDRQESRLAHQLSLQFEAKQKKFLCLQEGCFKLVARKRNHDIHKDMMVKVKSRVDLPLVVTQKLFKVHVTGNLVHTFLFYENSSHHFFYKKPHRQNNSRIHSETAISFLMQN